MTLIRLILNTLGTGLPQVTNRSRYNTGVSKWTDCIMDKIFENIRIVKFITTALKSVLNLVKLQCLVAKYCKMQKLQACKIREFCILLYHVGKTDTTIEKTVSM